MTIKFIVKIYRTITDSILSNLSGCKFKWS